MFLYTKLNLHLLLKLFDYWHMIFQILDFHTFWFLSNVRTFSSAEFKDRCFKRGFQSVSWAPYPPETNVIVKRFVETFCREFRNLIITKITQKYFPMQYWRTLTTSEKSLCELLNGPQIRTYISSFFNYTW